MTPRFFETAGSRLGAGPRAFQAVHIIAFPIQKRKEQREKMEKRIAESWSGDTDTVSIRKSDSVQAGADNGISAEETADAIKMEPVIYTKTGEASKSESGTNISVSV